MKQIGEFESVVLADGEVAAAPGARPVPVCFVFHELTSGKTERVWLDGEKPSRPPIDLGGDTLFVAYFASAELGVFLALNWELPVNVLDLYVEFSLMTSGRPTPCGRDLLGALAAFGIDGIEADEKEAMRDLILSKLTGHAFAADEKVKILNYCESDVIALKKLLPVMSPTIDLPRALIRGEYMKAIAQMERRGVPIDAHMLALFLENWSGIQDELIRRIDASRGIYEGRTFKRDNFMNYCARAGIVWPLLEPGKPALDDQSFREMARRFPEEIGPIHELRQSLSSMRPADLQVGADGRNRCLLSPFGSRSGRNQPSNTKFIFGPSTWLRGLIKPTEGRFVAYVDYSQQEIGIAAALSGDKNMMEAYSSGDLYLTFAKQAGAVPWNATKQTHAKERDQFKIVALAVGYGMGEKSLALKLGVPEYRAKELLNLHRRAYPAYWAWSDAAEAKAVLTGKLVAAFGWTVHALDADANPRSLRNFPAQANGAEMIRLACCLAIQRGIELCCPIHDALLVEGPADRVDEIVAATQQAMRDASEFVLPGFPLRSDAKVVKWPDRYMDPRGKKMWSTVCEILKEGGHTQG